MKELSLQNCRLDGRYDIQEFLGRGSYAEIYIARDILASPQSPHSRIVIKALNVFLQDDLDSDLEKTLVENFQNEAVALDRVRHPNIISRLGHGTARDLNGTVFHYLVLEYLPGGDLAKLRQKQNIEIPQALNYLEQVCAGLAHAHKNGVIHRDIKPQNLLLNKDLKIVKIADFGVAKLSQSNSPITRVGTQMYAPPEHSPMFAESMDVATFTELTPAADIYSLAKSAYVLLAGESPRRFTGFPISSLPSTLADKTWSGSLLRILRKATQNNPLERYQTVNEFWQELAQVKFTNESEEDAEELTNISPRPHLIPQAMVSKDFTPKTPLLPKFNTSNDLKISNLIPEQKDARLVVKIGDGLPIPPTYQTPQHIENTVSQDSQQAVKPGKKNSFIRRASIFLLLLGTFAFALFTTQNYLRNGRIFPKIAMPFSKPEGILKINTNLRSGPGTENPVIVLVPSGSKVRILNSNDKETWVEVEIINFNSNQNNPTDSNRGWMTKNNIDIQE